MTGGDHHARVGRERAEDRQTIGRHRTRSHPFFGSVRQIDIAKQRLEAPHDRLDPLGTEAIGRAVELHRAGDSEAIAQRGGHHMRVGQLQQARGHARGMQREAVSLAGLQLQLHT